MNTPQDYKCPKCSRLIYNRRLAACEFCGEKVPDRLRYTKEQMLAIDKEREESHERWLQRQREIEEEESRKGSGDLPMDFFGM